MPYFYTGRYQVFHPSTTKKTPCHVMPCLSLSKDNTKDMSYTKRNKRHAQGKHLKKKNWPHEDLSIQKKK